MRNVYCTESNPKCSNISTSANDLREVQLWCTLNFTGDLIPVMKWIDSSGTTIKAGTTPHSIQNNHINYTLNLNEKDIRKSLDKITKGHDGAMMTNYTCMAYFEAPKHLVESYADNAPEYKTSCISVMTIHAGKCT